MVERHEQQSSVPAGGTPGTGSTGMPPQRAESESTMDQVRRQGEEAFDQARMKGQQAAHAAEDAVDQGTDRAAEAAENLAGTLRERADSIPGGQKTTDIAYQTASSLDRGADYLRDVDAQEMRHDLEDLIRRHPAQSLAVGAAIGFLLARAFR